MYFNGNIFLVMVVKNCFFLFQGAGDIDLAMQCLNLCLASDSSHAPAFNNLAVLHHEMGRTNLAKAYLTTSKALEPELPEPAKNFEYLLNK